MELSNFVVRGEEAANLGASVAGFCVPAYQIRFGINSIGDSQTMQYPIKVAREMLIRSHELNLRFESVYKATPSRQHRVPTVRFSHHTLSRWTTLLEQILVDEMTFAC